jgi:hypothetical protein
MRTVLACLTLVTACSPADTEGNACIESNAITGHIVEGNEVIMGTPVPVPLKIAVAMSTDSPIDEIRVGDPSDAASAYFIPAQLTSASTGRWEALLFPTDIEHFREPGGFTATIPITAIDRCGVHHRIGESHLALGPAPGVVVQNLKIAPVDALPDCYVPPDGRVVLTMRVTADHSAVGAKVTVISTHGTWTNGMSTMDLTLSEGGTDARGVVLFTPTTTGVASLEVLAGGVSSDPPYQLVVAAPPTVTVTTTAPRRGATAWLDFSTDGNFDKCDVEESVIGSTTVAVVDPALGVIDETMSVKQMPVTCATTEALRVSVLFGATAPDGASVTVRCRESSYGRVVGTTLTVGAP